MPQEVDNGRYRKESDLFFLGIVLLEIDNYKTFDSNMISNMELSNLITQGIIALQNHKLNLTS